MAKVKAEAKYLRSGARKVRRVADLIRGKNASEALVMLKFLPHLGARYVEKVLKSAIANAKHNFKLSDEKLVISDIQIGDATPFKRFHPRARGSAFPILKRQCHIILYLDEAKTEEAKSGTKNPSKGI
jgi:large subunit ribosomal protein L22